MKKNYEMRIMFLLGILALLLIASASASLYHVDHDNLNPSDISKLTGGSLSISGTTFNDRNGDGFRTQDEPGLPGWTVILEHDGKDVRITTNDSGRYIFNKLEAGRYTVTENMVAKWNLTRPGAGNYTINLVDKDAINYNFGNILGHNSYVPQKHPIMAKDTWNQRTQAIKNLPKTGISPEGLAGVSYPSSFSLLSHIPYLGSERDQGYCGNCWVWGCMAPIEVAHDVQNGVLDRLSIQYLNSNYNGGSGYGWACCGGWESGFQNFYNTQGKFIPWSNSNANYQDGWRQCSDGTSVPSSSISTSPNYPITSIQWHEIQTAGVGTTQAISNIKSYLYANKAVTLGFYLPDFQPFWSFWSYNSGNWNPDSYCGQSQGAYPGGHEVTVVGWDDSTDSWIVLNSWGIDSAHPNGTFKLKMDMNYNCANGGSDSYSFGYFDVVFGSANLPPYTPSIPSGPSSGVVGTSYSYSTSTTDPDGDQVKYTFDWGDGTTSMTSLVNSGAVASAPHSWINSGIYQVRITATDSKGASSGGSNFLSISIQNSISKPTVTNGLGATSITSNSARLNGEVTDTGGEDPTARVYYGPNDGSTNPGLWANYDEGPVGLGSFYTYVNSLNPETPYYYRCYASNSAGSSWASSTATFTTLQSQNWDTGRTTPGATNWQAFSSNVIYVDVSTSAAGFTTTPRYFTSLGGSGNQRNAQGVSAIYSPTATGFRLYLMGLNGVIATPAYANNAGWYVQWLGVPIAETSSGQTTPGATNWQAFNSNVIYADVDTSTAGFTATPRYLTSLGGTGNQRNAQGISAIYSATPTGFRLYLMGTNGVVATPAYANSNGWNVQWLGLPSSTANAGATPIGATNWQVFNSNVIYADVDTSAAGFTATPCYFTSLGGTGNQRNAQGISAIYSATPTGFRLYLMGTNGVVATPAYANTNGWNVQWLGVV